jgi:hypothetical protein
MRPGFFDGKTFRCPKHREFQVADSVLSTPALMKADSNQWESALKKAAGRAAGGAHESLHMTSRFDATIKLRS